FTSARMFNAVFGFLMALTRFTAIWTKWKLGIAIAGVWLLTGAIVVFSMYIFGHHVMWMLDFRNKSFYRCLSRITIAAFAICIADLILPSMYLFFNYVVVLPNEKYNQTSLILSLVLYNFAFFVTNSLTVWVFILFVPR
ncbi:hypothetical protein PRIPAC_89477, partial [Pristionchus pacificus]|uniref:Uncharacterized protein n=1 Tax=Pristionchus pacificus TaxID=54126 RepID=A0A2A6B868_PRIPA